MRKAIQIERGFNAMIALCDDGTMWKRRGDRWQQLPEIPKDSAQVPKDSAQYQCDTCRHKYAQPQPYEPIACNDCFEVHATGRFSRWEGEGKAEPVVRFCRECKNS